MNRLLIISGVKKWLEHRDNLEKQRFLETRGGEGGRGSGMGGGGEGETVKEKSESLRKPQDGFFLLGKVTLDIVIQSCFNCTINAVFKNCLFHCI